MGFKKSVPNTASELKGYLKQISENRNHVKGVKVNLSNSHLEVDLDGMANFAGYPDVYMPIKRSRLNEAKALVDKLVSEIQQGFEPSLSDAEKLFDLIDHEAR